MSLDQLDQLADSLSDDKPASEEPPKTGRRGRPKGSKNKASKPDLDPGQLQALESQCKAVLGQLWGIIILRYDLPPALSQDEEQILGETSFAVVKKYIPIDDLVGPEAMLALALYTVLYPRYLDAVKQKKQNAPINATAVKTKSEPGNPHSGSGNIRNRKNVSQSATL